MTVARGYLRNNLFWMDVEVLSQLNAHHTLNPAIDLEIWHQRMGHMSHNALKRYKDSVKGISLDATNHDQSPCPGCELSKHTRSPFPSSSKRSDQILQIVHSNLAGPMQQRSIQGALYIATFIDDYSRNGVVYFLKSKDQTAAAFRKFLTWAKTQMLEHLRALHSDRGGKYISKALKSILDKKGVDHKLMMLGLPQQNGLAERWNRTLLDKARAMLHSMGLSLGFWELAIDTAAHIHNRTPSRTIG